MGNDGGSIPTRRELVKSAARAPTISELKATALESLSHAWSVCPLSSEPLDLENVVSDWRGRLYNYESVLKGLIPTATGGGGDVENTNGNDDSPAEDDAATPHEMTFASTGIKSLRDIVKLKLKRYKPAGSKEKEIWACPVSLKELGPSTTTKAVYVVPCGHVFAEVAIREIDERACPECSEPFEKSNVVPILPTEKAETDRLRQRIEALREKGLTHSLKKDKSAGKKKKRKAGDAENGDAAQEDGAESKTEGHPPSKAAKLSKGSDTKRASGINNPMTASLTARVLAEQEERNKQRKLAAVRG